MSDSSNSGSGRSFRVTKKKTAAKSAKSASKKASKSAKSATASKKRRAGTKIGATTIGEAFRNVLKFASPTSADRKNTRRLERAYRKRNPNSYEGLTQTEMKKKEAAQKAKLFRKLGKKVGRELGIKDKRIVLGEIEAANDRSRSAPNVNAVIHKLQLAPVKNEIKEFAKKQREIKKHNASLREAHRKEVGEFEGLAGKDFSAIGKAVLKKEDKAVTARDKEMGKAEYEGRKEQLAKEREDLEKRIKAAKKVVRDDFERYYRSMDSDRTPSDADILAVATLASHGFDVTPGEHRYLKKHLLDDITVSVRQRLARQMFEDGVEACDACVLEHYLKTV